MDGILCPISKGWYQGAFLNKRDCAKTFLDDPRRPEVCQISVFGCQISVFTRIQTICPKIWAGMQNAHFRLKCVAQKRPYLSSLLFLF